MNIRLNIKNKLIISKHLRLILNDAIEKGDYKEVE
jgi:hypothetical protein